MIVRDRDSHFLKRNQELTENCRDRSSSRLMRFILVRPRSSTRTPNAELRTAHQLRVDQFHTERRQ